MKITICGSIAFYTEISALRDSLQAQGHEVQIPELEHEAPHDFGGEKKINFAQYIEEKGGIDAFEKGHEVFMLKKNAILDHFKKIEWADAILVANYNKKGIQGYVGGNTLIEIGVAFYLKKKIFILNPIGSELSYKIEILGMDPTVVHGNLDLIQ
jgi:hypothetical protein